MKARKLIVGAAAAAVLVVSGGAVAFAQQDAQGTQGRPAAQERPANPGGAERDCPWEERQGTSGETEV